MENLETDTPLISSEFLCNNKNFLDFCKSLDAKKHAILVHRPLVETYRSLYLQNLKGPKARTTDFAAFVTEQEARDRKPTEKRGTVYNYPTLNRRMRNAGFSTHWIPYSHNSLIKRFWGKLRNISGQSLPNMTHEVPEKTDEKLSPLRSLHMGTADLCVEINKSFKAGLIPKETRKDMLGMLLDLSSDLKSSNAEHVDQQLVERIEQIDADINAGFVDEITAELSTESKI